MKNKSKIPLFIGVGAIIVAVSFGVFNALKATSTNAGIGMDADGSCVASLNAEYGCDNRIT